jgi:hypothetical protein
MKSDTITKYTSEQVYDYVFHNCGCHKMGIEKNSQYSAHIHVNGYIYQEHADSDIEARSKLANELSKSIYIRKNIKLDVNAKY